MHIVYYLLRLLTVHLLAFCYWVQNVCLAGINVIGRLLGPSDRHRMSAPRAASLKIKEGPQSISLSAQKQTTTNKMAKKNFVRDRECVESLLKVTKCNC